ncbi:hypothetical protein HID58_082032 [Brassica napus]|uniref:RRM domain-containing protein n=1 Tax=Brassica napus TaxID=3708 RepID=A0ABQ7YC73_BRANA|nr:hypothetical protein HID58_082032 [Brassica napus]
MSESTTLLLFLLLLPTMATFLTPLVSIKPTVFSFPSQSVTSPQTQTNVLSLKPFPSLAGAQSSRVRFIPHAVETEEKPASDPNAESSRRVYIGNIPRTVDNEQLSKLVEEHGAAENVQVMYDKYSGRSRRFGFATMKSVEDANAVIDKLNGTVSFFFFFFFSFYTIFCNKNGERFVLFVRPLKDVR